MLIQLSENEFINTLYEKPIGPVIYLSQDEHLNLILKTERILYSLRNLYTARPVLVSLKKNQEVA